VKPLLFGTAATDPLITAMMSLLVAVALLAGQIPARQASRIDPMAVLRGL
jgi:ABC-type lipoprotein release transport system permease subunit